MDIDYKLSSMGRSKSKLKPWRKNVYDNKGYKDNYTDTSFLEEMRKNVHFQEIHYSIAFIGAARVTQQICVVVLFSLVFVSLDFGWIEPKSVLYFCALMTGIGYMTRNYLTPRLDPINPDSAKINFSSSLIGTDLIIVGKCLALGHVLSPVLKTLTETISTDTIQAAAAIAFTVHLVTYDYGIGNEPGLPYRVPQPAHSEVSAPSHWSLKPVPLFNQLTNDNTSSEECYTKESLNIIASPRDKPSIKEDKLASLQLHNSSRESSALSLNAAIFGATCLASRLASSSHAFSLLSAAGLAFALSPPFLKLLQNWTVGRIGVPITLFLTTVYFLFLCCESTSNEDWLVSFMPLTLFIMVVIFLNVLCPYMFVLWQTHKDNIYGPWDEAVPLITRTTHTSAASVN